MPLLKENLNISGLLLDCLDEERSRMLILKALYPDGPKCPRCGAIFPARIDIFFIFPGPKTG